MVNVKYVLMVLCTFSICAKIVGHSHRHPNLPVVTTAQP